MKRCYYCNQKNDDLETHCKTCHVDLAVSQKMRLFQNIVVLVLPLMAMILLIITIALWIKIHQRVENIFFSILTYVAFIFCQLHYRSPKIKSIGISMNFFRKPSAILPAEMQLVSIISGVMNIFILLMAVTDILILFTQIS